MSGSHQVLSYFDHLRTSEDISFREGSRKQNEDGYSSSHPEEISSIIALTDPATGEEIRLANVPVILPLTWFGGSLTEDAMDLAMAVTLAVHHFNIRNAVVVPELKSPELEDCNVKVTFDLWDGEYSAAATSAAFVHDVMANVNASNPLRQPRPTALVGARWSSVTSILSKLSSAYEVPLISPSASSTEFSSKINHPFFLRIVPSVSASAVALVDYFQSIGVQHFGVLFDSSSFGLTFANAVVDKATSRGMEVLHIPVAYYEGNTTTQEIRQAMKELKRIQYKYFFTINFDMTYFNEVLTEAYNAGLTGSEYSWWMNDGISFNLFNEGLVYSQDDPLTQAMNGIGFLHLSEAYKFERYQKFKEEWNLLGQNTNALAYIQEKLPTAVRDKLGDSFPYRKDPDIMSLFLYDSLITIGMGACRRHHQRRDFSSSDVEEFPLPYFFSGPELYRSMVRTHFHGASNIVSFQNTTGDRNYGDNLLFMANARLENEPNAAGDSILKLHPTAAYISASSAVTNEILSSSSALKWKPFAPFVFPNNSTIPPLDLPSLVSYTHMISPGALAGGLVMASIALLLGVACLGGTMFYSNEPYVRAFQPEFLAMICLGCIIMASSVIPAGVQGGSSENSVLVSNSSCMATPWLVCIGFVTSFSVLFAKTLRLNKLVLAKAYRKMVVRKRDVLLPFVLLLLSNVIALTVWTLVAPLRWIQNNYISVDPFGRSVESIAMCAVQEGKKLPVILCVLVLVVINITSVALAAYQGFLCRNINIEFNESNSIFICLMSILQTSIIGVPVFLTVLHMPSARFLVYSLLVSLLCVSILVPLFTPKWFAVQKRRRAERMTDDASNKESSVHIEQHPIRRRQQHQHQNAFDCIATSTPEVSIVLSRATFEAAVQRRKNNYFFTTTQGGMNDDDSVDDLSKAVQQERSKQRMLLEEQSTLENDLKDVWQRSPDVLKDVEANDNDFPDITKVEGAIIEDVGKEDEGAIDDDFDPDPDDEQSRRRHKFKDPSLMKDVEIESCSSLNFLLRRINFDSLYTDTSSSGTGTSSFSKMWASSRMLGQTSTDGKDVHPS